MKKIEKISGKAMPLAMNDVDTDLIIPAQYLTSTEKSGYGKNLFRRLRDADSHFIYNQAVFRDANILITQESFGCGSSREHAVWALREAGFDAIIAVSFGDIFANNSGKNGLVLITLPEVTINALLHSAKAGDYSLNICLIEEIITTSLGDKIPFKLNAFQRYCFLKGLEDIDYIREKEDKTRAFKEKQPYRQWLNINDEPTPRG